MADSSQLESQQIIDETLPYTEDELISLQTPIESSPRGRFFILCLLLLPISLIPITKSIYIPFIGNTIMDHRVFLVLMMGLLTMILKVTAWRSRPINPQTKKWFLLPLIFLGLIQAISIIWGPVESETRIYSFLSAVLLWSSVFAGVSVISGMSYERRHNMARWLVLLLTGIMVVYILGSTRFAGLRPSAGFYYREEVLPGIQRLGGPLSGATGLNFILLPALGYSIGLILLGGRSKIFWAIVSFILFISILLTGSLGGILGLLVMGILVIIILRVKSLGVFMPVALLIGGLILWVGIPERLQGRNLSKTARYESYVTALHAFSSSPPAVLFGVGQGTLYRPSQVYHYSGISRTSEGSHETDYGLSLKGSHSTFLQSLAETGVIGFTFLVVVVVWVLWRLFGWRYNRFHDPWMLHARLTLAGCVSTMFLMIFGVFFFYNYWLTVIWTVFLIVGVESIEETSLIVAQDTSAGEYTEDY